MLATANAKYLNICLHVSYSFSLLIDITQKEWFCWSI